MGISAEIGIAKEQYQIPDLQRVLAYKKGDLADDAVRNRDVDMGKQCRQWCNAASTVKRSIIIVAIPA